MRAQLGCSRHDLPRVEWHVDVNRIAAVYSGRHEHEARAAGADVFSRCPPGLWEWKRPPEAPGDGCPGGWYRSPFAASVLRYVRTRTEGGARVPNPLLDRADDPLIEAAVLYFEREQERVYALQTELIQAKRESGK